MRSRTSAQLDLGVDQSVARDEAAIDQPLHSPRLLGEEGLALGQRAAGLTHRRDAGGVGPGLLDVLVAVEAGQAPVAGLRIGQLGAGILDLADQFGAGDGGNRLVGGDAVAGGDQQAVDAALIGGDNLGKTGAVDQHALRTDLDRRAGQYAPRQSGNDGDRERAEQQPCRPPDQRDRRVQPLRIGQPVERRLPVDGFSHARHPLPMHCARRRVWLYFRAFGKAFSHAHLLPLREKDTEPWRTK